MLHICIFLQSPSPRRAWIEIAFTRSDSHLHKSPSPRRAWIEILNLFEVFIKIGSPSPRRAWIEILCNQTQRGQSRSPSPRRAWIEIKKSVSLRPRDWRRPPHGGRGLKWFCLNIAIGHNGRPPHGGRGLKYGSEQTRTALLRSPSPRRAWIEISTQAL